MAMPKRTNIIFVSTDNKSNLPYKSLGLTLQRIRQKSKQSISEVSGSVEIDEKILLNIEEGVKRPSEDLLLLLISHFNIEDSEASKLWDLSGYENETTKIEEEMKYPPIMLLMPMDSRVIYSDKSEVVASTNGLVINFMQFPNGPYPNQTVSRIGMSHEQASELVNILSKTLMHSKKAKNDANRTKTEDKSVE
jgi:transcriptional regulator with XRE-family HTH domain